MVSHIYAVRRYKGPLCASERHSREYLLKGIIMNEYNTKAEMAEKVFIRTFRENASGAIFRFPIVGMNPNNVRDTALWFTNVLRPGLYEVSSMIPSNTDYEIPRIEIDAFALRYSTGALEQKPDTIVVLPYGIYGTDVYTGVDQKGLLVQTKASTLFNKELFTEVHDSLEDPSINLASELGNDLVEFIGDKDEHPSQEDKNAIVFCEEDRLKALHAIDEILECGGFLHADWPYYAKNAVTQIDIAFISDPKLYVRNVTSEKDLDKNCVKHYVVGELRQKLGADGRKHKIIVYPIYRDSGSIGNVLTLIPTKYAYLRNGNTDVDDVLYDTYIKEV